MNDHGKEKNKASIKTALTLSGQLRVSLIEADVDNMLLCHILMQR